ncbi:hypothetical protein ACLKA7_009950 [Drosophila subpalustris]
MQKRCFDKNILDIRVGCTTTAAVDGHLNAEQLAARLHSALRCRSMRLAITLNAQQQRSQQLLSDNNNTIRHHSNNVYC